VKESRASSKSLLACLLPFFFANKARHVSPARECKISNNKYTSDRVNSDNNTGAAMRNLNQGSMMAGLGLIFAIGAGWIIA